MSENTNQAETSADTSAETDLNLDEFSKILFNKDNAAQEKVEEVSDATNEKTIEANDDALATAEEDSEEKEAKQEDEESKPAPKKNRFQERIDELTGSKRAAERKAAELEQKLNDLIAKLDKPATETAKSTTNVDADDKFFEDGPQPTDLNEDGSDKYPLGEFDPAYIRAVTKHALRQEREILKKAEEAENQQREYQKQQQAVVEAWTEKLESAKERYPDFEDKGQNLVNTFSDIDQAYGEYLSGVIMSMDNGPDVFYYLADNPKEAQKIVNLGATKATVALGRLEAQIASSSNSQQVNTKISKAPPPPAHFNKGSSVSKATVPDDTDDLDAFAAKLFSKKK